MDSVERLLTQLLKEVRATGATTLTLLEGLEVTSDAHRIINEMDSQLSVWEDDIVELQKHL